MPNEDRPDSRPAGSHPPARRPAGAGAVRELCEVIMQAKGYLKTAWEQYTE